MTGQIIEPHSQEARLEDIDYVGEHGYFIIYAVTVGCQHRSIEDHVEQQIAFDGQADDVGAAYHLISGISGINALAAVAAAGVLNEESEGGGLLEDPRGEAQLDEVVIAERSGESHLETRLDGLCRDFNGLAVEQRAGVAKNLESFLLRQGTGDRSHCFWSRAGGKIAGTRVLRPGRPGSEIFR